MFVTNHFVTPHFSISQFDYYARHGCSKVKGGLNLNLNEI